VLGFLGYVEDEFFEFLRRHRSSPPFVINLYFTPCLRFCQPRASRSIGMSTGFFAPDRDHLAGLPMSQDIDTILLLKDLPALPSDPRGDDPACGLRKLTPSERGQL